MTRIATWITGSALALALSLSLSAPAHGQQPPGSALFQDAERLQRLLDVAKEAGFTDEQIKSITVEDESRLIRAWEHIQEQKLQRERLEKAKAEREKRVYLTVQDVFNELLAADPEDLKKLRDSLFLNR
ncbi:MAG: hypothetical protein HY423_10005 [Candidatus Lambdaproteobacteria bacterium]|nr:hypothetical protein [Candidatus Lambdaproteobacteria bacterium]